MWDRLVAAVASHLRLSAPPPPPPPPPEPWFAVGASEIAAAASSLTVASVLALYVLWWRQQGGDGHDDFASSLAMSFSAARMRLAWKKDFEQADADSNILYEEEGGSDGAGGEALGTSRER